MYDILLPWRKLYSKLKTTEIEYRNRNSIKNYLKTPRNSKIYILGSPVYNNLGDSAILIAEMKLVEKCGYTVKQIKEVTFDEYYKYRRYITRWINRECLICGLGGGNMGNQWPGEEKFRYDMFDDFPNNPIVIFPQTIYFLPNSNDAELKSISYYNENDNITLVAREEKSYEIMRELYPDANILLTPDIVLSTTMTDYGVVPQKRKGVLICARSDAEKSVDDSVWNAVREELLKSDIEIRQTDMYSDRSVTKENRLECVREKMQEFCGAELVITDRLHGMVFAAITATPCIVFSNYNQKVKGTYDWISYLPYVKYAETADEAIAVIPELLEMKNCKFDNTPLMKYYENLAEVVKERCRK